MEVAGPPLVLALNNGNGGELMNHSYLCKAEWNKTNIPSRQDQSLNLSVTLFTPLKHWFYNMFLSYFCSIVKCQYPSLFINRIVAAVPVNELFLPQQNNCRGLLLVCLCNASAIVYAKQHDVMNLCNM